MPYSASRSDTRGSRFVHYIGGMRLLGSTTGALGLGAALHGHGVLQPWWPLLAFTVLGWPLLAWRLAAASTDPVRTEFRNLTLDAGLAGFWIAIARFDLLPAVMLAAVMAMDRTVAGGWVLARNSMLAMIGVALATAALNGFAFEPRTRFATMLWCMPFLVLYLLAVGISARVFSDRVHARNRVLQKSSRIDAATGLANRRQLLAMAAVALKRFHRHGEMSSLLMIDIDAFKQINDGHGHLAGDRVIGEVALLLQGGLRGQDVAGRYGGDEFGVLLVGAGREAALEVAERLRERVAQRVRVQDQVVTLSIGMSELAPGMHAIEDWAEAADAALYRAKAAGRNCVRE